jgi:hypothetical protein
MTTFDSSVMPEADMVSQLLCALARMPHAGTSPFTEKVIAIAAEVLLQEPGVPADAFDDVDPMVTPLMADSTWPLLPVAVRVTYIRLLMVCRNPERFISWGGACTDVHSPFELCVQLLVPICMDATLMPLEALQQFPHVASH